MTQTVTSEKKFVRPLTGLPVVITLWILGMAIVGWIWATYWNDQVGIWLLFFVVLPVGLIGLISHVIALLLRRQRASSNPTLERDVRNDGARPSP